MIISRILIALCCTPVLFAESGAIGLAVADGSLLLNRIRVWGNATLFDGSGVETTSAISLLHLVGGTQIRLGASTRATVFQRKLILEKGIGQLEAAGTNYEIQARSLRILPDSANALTRIKLEDGDRVIVAAIRGEVRVANAAGVLVAN